MYTLSTLAARRAAELMTPRRGAAASKAWNRFWRRRCPGPWRYCDGIASLYAAGANAQPCRALKWAYCCAMAGKSHWGGLRLENADFDIARREPRGIHERCASHPSRRADGCRAMGEKGRGRQVGRMVYLRGAQRHLRGGICEALCATRHRRSPSDLCPMHPRPQERTAARALLRQRYAAQRLEL